MFISVLTIFNILLFLLSIALFYSVRKKQEKQARPKHSGNGLPDPSAAEILEIYQNAVSKIMYIRNLHLHSRKKLESATRNSVQQLSSIIQRLETTTGKTTEILDMMRDKVSLSLVRDTMDSTEEQATEAVRKKYEQMLKEVEEQLALLVDRKTEDIRKLERLRTGITRMADQARAGASGEDFESGLRQTAFHIEDAVSSLQEAADVESVFIHSTVSLLQDLVLSLVTSFIQLKTIIDNTLGESSTVGEEISTIIVNLQCEDICKEMSQYTLDILSRLITDLHRLDFLGISQDELLAIDKAEAAVEFEPDDAQDKEDVTFF